MYLVKDQLTSPQRQILYKYLKDAKHILSSRNIPFWLDCGTLLGAIRDSELISWDKDIDLGCFKSKNDYKQKQNLKRDFITFGYSVYLTDYWINVHHPNHENLNLDINFYTIDNNNAITPSSSLTPFLNDNISILANHLIKFVYNKKFTINKYNFISKYILKIMFSIFNIIFFLLPQKQKNTVINFLIHIRKSYSKHKAEVVPKFFFEDFYHKEVFDDKYPVPIKSDEYLEFRYGMNWRTPQQVWDTLTQDNTVRDIV